MFLLPLCLRAARLVRQAGFAGAVAAGQSAGACPPRPSPRRQALRNKRLRNNAVSYRLVEGFDDIRPYRDDEVAAVLRRVTADVAVARAATALLAPAWRRPAGIAPAVVRWALRRRTRRVDSVEGFQRVLSIWVERLIRRTTSGFGWSGLDGLDANRPHLFVSNHRDIAVDSGLMNYALWRTGHRTSQIAVGDNLFAPGVAQDLMRLNKSFMVQRGATGAKAQYAALAKTSRYIRAALAEGESVWIAQREGRAKDGLDRTEPALLKMFLLAWREDRPAFGDWLRRVSLVPVSVSYELDPCAGIKARELYHLARDGKYEKAEGEDLASMAQGILGFKGRAHVAFGTPVTGNFERAEALARRLDEAIVGNLKTFPTQVYALEGAARMSPRVERAFHATLDGCPPEHREFVLLQYANQLRNKRRLLEDGAA